MLYAEELLTKPEDLLGIMEILPDPCMVVNTKGNIILANKLLNDLFGYDDQELDQEPMHCLLLDDHRNMHEGHFKAYFANPKSRRMGKNLNIYGIKKDGSVIPIDVSLIPIYKNEPLVIASIRDLTELKKIEQKLAYSTQMSLISESLSIINYVVEPKQRNEVTYISPNVEKITGYEPASFVHNHTFWFERIHPLDKAEVYSKRLQLYKDGNASCEYRLKVKWGEYRWFFDNLKIVKLGGQIDHIAGFMIDITEKKQREMELVFQRKKLEEAQIIARLGHFVWHQENNILEISDQLIEVLGLTENKDLLNSKKLFYLIEEKHRFKALYKIRMSAYKPDNTVDMDLPIIVNGLRKFINLKGKMEGVSKINRVFSATVQEITERKIAEQEIIDSKNELSARKFELDQFVYRISHDLQAPVSSILGLVNLLKYEKKDVDLSEYITRIGSSALMLDSFLKSINNHLKVINDEGKQKEVIDFHNILKNCLTNLRNLHHYDRLKVSLEVDNQEIFNYTNDPQKIEIIFNNLLSNAIQYIDPNKPENRLDISINESNGFLIITLRDNGLGMTDGILKNVFNMFYRGTEISTGSGLGLYIVKQAVVKLKGTIYIRSVQGEFTLIEIKIPFNS